MRGTLAFLLCCLGSPLAAQDAPVADLGVFAKLSGHWTGDAWMIRGPEGRQQLRQEEWVTPEAGGTVIAIRGLGTAIRDGVTDTVHHAFAVVHRNRDGTGMAMRAFTADGRWIDLEIAATDSSVTWGFADPRAGRIKYEMTLGADGRWQEDGYASRDSGATWFHFMGMTLTRESTLP